MIEKEQFYQTLIMNRVRNQLGLYNIEETTDHEAEPVTVAVLDSGIDSRHPDLEGKVLAFQDFIANRNIP